MRSTRLEYSPARLRVMDGLKVLWLAAAALIMNGCLQVAPQPPVPPTSMSSWGPLGGFSVSSGAPCAGKATLSDGTASVSDACFSGTNDIVMCTDTSAANPVKCTPGTGVLQISGGLGDTIAYARVR
jgi:hypothetical protein